MIAFENIQRINGYLCWTSEEQALAERNIDPGLTFAEKTTPARRPLDPVQIISGGGFDVVV